MTRTGRLAAAAFTLYVVIGATQAYYGPAIPSLRERFGITAAAAGLAVGTHFLGALAGVVCWGVLERRWSSRTLLVIADVLLAAGCALVAVASTWELVLAAILLIGLGFGGLDVGYNVVFSHAFGRRTPLLLNLLHACFGIGAILGPIVLSLAPAGDFRPAFLVSGAFAIVTAPLILAGPAPTAPQPATDEPVPRALRRRLAVFVALFVLYVGVETGIGGWAPTHLAATGRTVTDAARWTAGFWAAFTAGRLLGAGLTVRVRSDRLVIGGLACGAVCLLAATRPGIAGMAYIAAGLALAPVFPTGVAWLSAALPGVRSGTATVLGGALLGGVTVPPLIGQVVNVAGPGVVPWLLAGVALVATAVGLIVASDARGDLRGPTADVTTMQD